MTGGRQQSRATGQEGEEGPERSKSGFSAGLLTSRCSSSPPISVHRRFAVDLPLPPLLGLSTFRLSAFSPSPQFSFNATCASTIRSPPPLLFQLWLLELPHGYSTRVSPVSPPRFNRDAFAVHPLWPWSPRISSRRVSTLWNRIASSYIPLINILLLSLLVPYFLQQWALFCMIGRNSLTKVACYFSGFMFEVAQNLSR